MKKEKLVLTNTFSKTFTNLLKSTDTVKPVKQPAGYIRFEGFEVRVKLEGGL